jgi:type III secretion protein J
MRTLRCFQAVFTAMLISLFLQGCSQQLYEDLSEAEANEVTATLRLEGINASKISLKDKKWGVEVPSAAFARAVMILKDRNLPVFGYEGLGKMFRKDSLLVTPVEERARLMHALSEELTLTLRRVDGVLDARVHVVIPAKDVLSKEHKPASASVLIKTRPGVDLSGQVENIRSLVINSVEGVTAETVSIMAVVAPSVSVEPPRPSGGSASYAAIVMLVLAGSLLVAGMLFMPKVRKYLGEALRRLKSSGGRGGNDSAA